MSAHGFIDPSEPSRARIERLEDLLLDLVLALTDRSALSQEAQNTLADLEADDAIRNEHARRMLHAQMAADPIDEPSPTPAVMTPAETQETNE